MSKIPLPQQGQPIDLNYIYTIANTINDLSSQVSPSTYKYVTIDTPTNSNLSVKNTEARTIGGYVEVYSNTNVTAGGEKDFSYTFPGGEFKYPPVAVATPINAGGTDAGKSVSVVLKTITTSKVDGVVKFSSSGNLSIGISLIIIGIPN